MPTSGARPRTPRRGPSPRVAPTARIGDESAPCPLRPAPRSWSAWCRSASGAASSSSRPRSTAASTASGTTARSASSSRTTCATPGGTSWCTTRRRAPTAAPIEIVGLDCSIISHPRVWEASGHVGGFADPMQTCRQCKRLFRADHVAELLDESEWVASLLEVCEPGAVPGTYIPRARRAASAGRRRRARSSRPGSRSCASPALIAGDRRGRARRADAADASSSSSGASRERACGSPARSCGGDLTEPRQFNLMFETYVGAVRDEESQGLPPARDRAGHVLQLQERPRLDAREGAVRHLPGRPQLPQRGDAAQLHLPLARVRADGARVLRPPERGRPVVPATGAQARFDWWCCARARRQEPAAARPRARTSWRTTPRTRAAAATSSTPSRSRARRASPSSRASPTAATTT